MASCASPGCRNPARRAGHCWKHYVPGGTCEGPDCDRPAKRGQYCWGHGKQNSRGLPLRPLRPPKGGVLSPREQFDLAVLALAMLRPSDKTGWRRAWKRIREAAVRLAFSTGRVNTSWRTLQEAIFASYEVPAEDDAAAKRAQRRAVQAAIAYGATMRRRTLRPHPGRRS